MTVDRRWHRLSGHGARARRCASTATTSSSSRGSPGKPRRGAVAAATGTRTRWLARVDGADAVINLAGESIAGGRWTARARHAIRAQPRRGDAARWSTAIAGRGAPPPVFLSGSAIGFYGARGDEPARRVVAGRHRLPRPSVCARVGGARRWRAAARTRVVLLRTGLVLARDGGALPQLALPFRLVRRRPARVGPPGTCRGSTSRLGRRWCGGRSTTSHVSRAAESHRAGAGDQRGVRARARPRAAAAGVRAGAGVRAAPALGEMADALILGRSARAADEGAGARLRVHATRRWNAALRDDLSTTSLSAGHAIHDHGRGS